ncbi:MAG TPA: anti-sigma factor antagonist [Candidatus Omnitrophica bacterium]|mgnify:CR=1 FL=1|nr:MAG: anti-sigma factor antagonist [Candidatus Omnitrophota bacterium]RKY42818.1 MAG: anti-sigma factor antagonist [Candidatus Omnitrophota bacterium]HEC69046.1 anti-sigma factor antagonist [Candidatus Omnitrophota bacterium]
MQINQKTKNGVVVCYLKGEINIDTVPKLKETFEIILKNKFRKVLLSFKGVEYIDSLGIATLIDFSKRLLKREGILFLCELSSNLRSIFGITKVDKVFKIYETEEEALKEFYGY